MAGLADQPTEATLAAIAAPDEAAAAGVACALTAAAAAALVELSAGLAADRLQAEAGESTEAGGLRGIVARATELRAAALAAADEDAGAYARVRGAPGDLERAAAIEQAADPPTRIAEAAAEIAEAAAQVAAAGSWPFTPDARAAAALAATAADGAASLVDANLQASPDDPRLARAEAAAHRAAQAAARS